MADLIDRQLAITAIQELCDNYMTIKNAEHPHMNRVISVEHPHIDSVIEKLNNLPSAQPDCADCICHSGNRDCGRFRV